MPGWSVLAGAAIWLGLLFAVALLGERRPALLQRGWPVVYALSLAVYCTAWTFYGTVTQAARSGWPIPPTFVGTIALFLFGWPFLLKLVRLGKAANSTSLADFIASRLGKSSVLAAAVTAVAVLGMVPYIALQLKAVAMSASVLSRGGLVEGLPAWQDGAFWVALFMAVFAMLFGTRRAAATEHNRGLVLAMAFESLLKLGALLALGLWVMFSLSAGPAEVFAEPQVLGKPTDLAAFATLSLLGVLAMFTLPHQFHIGVVECRDESHLRWARWLFPLFLLLISLPILVLAEAGLGRLGAQGVPSDLYVLLLPLGEGRQGLAMLTFLGGLSAATGMVVLASLALSIMIGNHWITPWLLSQGWPAGRAPRLPVLLQRRIGIVLVLGLAWVYSRMVGGSAALADIGALSFSGLAHLAPAVLLAVYRPQVSPGAVLAGMVAGVLVWAVLLMQPLLVPEGLSGPLSELDPLTRSVLLSLGLNLAVIALWQRLARPAQSSDTPALALAPALQQEIARRFLSAQPAERALDPRLPPAEREARLELELAAVLGGASARLLLDAARQRTVAPLEAVAELVDQAAEQARFSQRVLEGALENMSQGICVVDAQLCLVAWNRRYQQLFDYPPGLLAVGRPVAALMRHNAEHGLLVDAEVEAAIQRRLQHMRAGTPHLSERHWPDGSVIEIRGNPLPQGGFVATFTDVSAFRGAERALIQANETLEQRVRERTAELQQAREQAEAASAAKSRLLAAVSHDLVQPLNAAQLFTHALVQQADDPALAGRLRQIDQALGATESLLSGLLDISRLESGRQPVHRRPLALAEVLDPLADEFAVLAARAGLKLRYRRCAGSVDSDPLLLRRIVQNFLANAVRYTGHGSLLLGCRRAGGAYRIEVHDTGPGIAEADQAVVFDEFRRLHGGGGGLGLGLAIASRTAALLGHRLGLRSWPGRGSVFSVWLPAASGPARVATPAAPGPLALGLRVLVVDNEAAAREGMAALLGGWGCEVACVADGRAALRREQAPDIALLDVHLDDGEDGLVLAARLRERWPELPLVMVTADHGAGVRAQAAALDLQVVFKPVKPLKLRTLLGRIRPRSSNIHMS